jgi:hypothetical protein
VHRGEREIGRKELASKDDRVDVVKEMQVDVRNATGIGSRPLSSVMRSAPISVRR